MLFCSSSLNRLIWRETGIRHVKQAFKGPMSMKSAPDPRTQGSLFLVQSSLHHTSWCYIASVMGRITVGHFIYGFNFNGISMVVPNLLPFSAKPGETFSKLFYFILAAAMTNVISDIQPECIFIPFPPVKISQKYLLPEMENSLPISQMITLFKSSTRLPCAKS